MHYRHISAKIQLKNLKQHFNWGAGPLGPPLATPLHQAHYESSCSFSLIFLNPKAVFYNYA